jgi:hypothetical protein
VVQLVSFTASQYGLDGQGHGIQGLVAAISGWDPAAIKGHMCCWLAIQVIYAYFK